MRLVPRHWHSETWICSIRGHATPALTARTLLPDDHRIGIDLADGTRFARCLRCDAWVEDDAPSEGAFRWDTLPPLNELPLPRRGKPLADAIFLRLIAIDRALHSLVFGLLALALLFLELKLPVWRDSIGSLSRSLDDVAGTTGRNAGRDWLGSLLHGALQVDKHTLGLLLATATAYCVVEGVEAYGLWRERRWAEYLTAVATAGLLPLEIHELIKRVTVLRLGALIVNLAILAWLVWNKHLFGVQGGEPTLHEDTDWDAVLAGSATARGRHARTESRRS